MDSSRFGILSRVMALIAFAALFVVFLGPAMGFAEDTDAAGERCIGCPGCENGECGEEDENPLTSHHHCCPTSCMSHAPFALPTAPSSSACSIAERMLICTASAVNDRSPDTPYRPPRV